MYKAFQLDVITYYISETLLVEVIKSLLQHENPHLTLMTNCDYAYDELGEKYLKNREAQCLQMKK